MGKVEIETNIKVKLTLTKEEALWLKELTQNDLTEETKVRYRIFNALPSWEILQND